MSEQQQAPRGTYDVLPGVAEHRARLVDGVAAPAFARAGYARIETPAFEHTELFARGVGESTEIVSKEMYTFTDQGERSLTLRPEGTAPVCRAYVEHGMHKLAQPVKLWYEGSFFRQEAPQAGRFRQFFQIGAEALGSDDPALDAEAIVLLARMLEAAGATGCRLRISSLGSSAERAAYSDQLKVYLRANEAALSADVRERIELNPLRAFDAKHEGTQAVMTDAPRLLSSISGEDRAHFDDVLALLTAAGVAYEIDDTLVRGLDYYTRTVFEFTSDRLGAQSGVGGGGRYDGLVELLGGPPTPGIGWAAGVERVLAVAEAAGAQPAAAAAADAYIALDAEADREAAFALACALRERGLAALIELGGRSLKGQLKQADRAGAKSLVILGGGRAAYDAAVKNMHTGEQRELNDLTKQDYIDRIAAELIA
ncbi:MAG: histidine--tRNA ligase [Actinobacteria bacterium]|nr:histidine--tRNA ligase [Actinomycetota bacterium]